MTVGSAGHATVRDTGRSRPAGRAIAAVVLAAVALTLGPAPASTRAEPLDFDSMATWPIPDPNATDFRAGAEQIAQAAERLVADTGLPGLALTIVQDDRILVARGYGVVEAGRDEPVTERTAFRLASLSKGFAGALATMLVREGALRWDSRVTDYLPAFQLADPEAAGRLTVRDILSHQVGIQTYNFLDRDLEADQPYPLLAARLDQAPMRCAPGECYAYQNIAFSLIGDISFAVTGEFFTLSVEKRLLHPLGMHEASFGRPALESSPSWARPHVGRGRVWRAVAPKENYYRVPPAAGINASALDMAPWLMAQLGHRPGILPDDLLRELHAPLAYTPDQLGRSPWRRARLRQAHYALGWRIYDYAGRRLIYHGGAVQGYRALVAVLPDRGVGVSILWNSEHPAPSQLLPATLDLALGLDPHDWLAADADLSLPGRAADPAGQTTTSR